MLRKLHTVYRLYEYFRKKGRGEGGTPLRATLWKYNGIVRNVCNVRTSPQQGNIL